ncbi:hypothetical protein CUMW_189880 [Citrus unshiu]|nr:hypothetical protein CUMW_189880 [Citrus unshiu]
MTKEFMIEKIDCRRCGSKRCIHSSETQRKTKEKKKKSLQNKKFSNKALTEYISYDVPVGKGRNDLRSYIGVIEKSTKPKEKIAQNVYNHCLGSIGYGGMLYRKFKGIDEYTMKELSRLRGKQLNHFRPVPFALKTPITCKSILLHGPNQD